MVFQGNRLPLCHHRSQYLVLSRRALGNHLMTSTWGGGGSGGCPHSARAPVRPNHRLPPPPPPPATPPQCHGVGRRQQKGLGGPPPPPPARAGVRGAVPPSSNRQNPRPTSAHCGGSRGGSGGGPGRCPGRQPSPPAPLGIDAPPPPRSLAPGAPFDYSAPPPPLRPLKDWPKYASGPSADQTFSPAPNVSFGAFFWGGGGWTRSPTTPPPPPPKGALLTPPPPSHRTRAVRCSVLCSGGGCSSRVGVVPLDHVPAAAHVPRLYSRVPKGRPCAMLMWVMRGSALSGKCVHVLRQ